jgi:ABC-2 type transport system permease protein
MKSFLNDILRVMQREYQRFGTRATYAFFAFIGPLVAFTLVIWLFSYNVPRELPVALVDQDHTPLSRKLASVADATPIAHLQSFPDIEAAKEAFMQGKVDAIYLIPSGTEKNILSGLQADVVLYLNNTNVLKGGLLTSGIMKSCMTLSAGIQVLSRTKKGETWDQAVEATMPVMPDTHILFNPFINYSYFLASMLLPVMLIVFVLMGSVYAIGTELRQGTGLHWLESAGGNIWTALLGKMLPYTFIFLIQAWIMDLLLFHYLEVPLHGHLHVLLVTQLLLILSYQFLAVFLLALTFNLRLSLSLAAAYTMMALTFSGLTYPIADMPPLARSFASLFPFTYYLQNFIGQAMRNEPPANGLIPMLWLWAFIVLGILFVPRLRYLLTDEKYWGKI